MAQDATKIAPHVYSTVFENDRVRLLEVRMKPGDHSELHSHPDYLLYTLQGGRVKLSGADGESVEVEINAGDSMWRGAEEHSAHNVGDGEFVALFIEPK